MKFWATGLVPAVYTPFKENGDIDYEKIGPYCEFLVKHDIKYVYVNGTTGEAASMTLEERKAVLEEWIKVSKKRVTVIAQVGALNLKDSQELAKHAQIAGADAIASLCSLFFKPSTIDALVHYCKEITEAAPEVPFYYYHLPAMTHVTFSMEEFAGKAKSEIPTFVGIKYSGPDLPDMLGCCSIPDVNVLYGSDQQLLGALSMGAHGAVGSTYSFLPTLNQRIIQLHEEGRISEARNEQLKSQKFYKVMAKYGGSYGAVTIRKAAMTHVGLDMGPVREPLVPLTKSQIDNFGLEIKEIGFFDWIKNV